ncbi:prominin-1-A isoform X7 [Clinocottus analis]|uniref:prominin-1-A isoform X7 n=1 Tax=Clinocottus analis TaxID=304258 RepID=UPI0035C100D5
MWKSGVLPLLWVFLASGELQPDPGPRRLAPPGKLDFGYVPAGVYETLAHYEPGPIGILFHMVHAFLYVVQPNAFPQDLIVKLAKDKFGAIQTEYQKAIYYEIGFLVCAAVGLLFAVLVPMIGLFFCMCRCCDNCGGEMHQRQRKNADCRRGLLGTLLFSTSLVITIGVLCAYSANQNLSSQVKNIRRLVNSNMRDLHTFANDTPMQIDYLISQYATAKNKVIYDLDNIGPLLGGRIHDQLDKEVHPALDRVLNMAGAMRETKEALENVNVGLEVLQEGTGKLNFNLSLVRTSINRTLNDPGCHDEESDATTAQLCRNIRQSLSQLQIGANFTRLPKVNAQLEKMNDVLRTDLSAIVQTGYSSLNDTPNMVVEQTRSVVESVHGLVDGIGNNISSFSKVFPVQSSLSNFTIFISHAHAKIEDHYPEIDKMDFYRWIGCIALCCMVVLVLAFNYLGLLCGTLGYDKHASPTTRGCISNTGGTMLMAGVGFTVIFSWVLMGVVTTIFLAGGNMEKLFCEPFHTKEVFKVVDTPYLVNADWKNFIPGYMYNDSDLELTAESLYSTCKENKGIYSAMRLDRVFNISVFLNTTVFTKDVVSQLDSVKIDLRGIILLEAEGKQNLLDFSEAGLSEINYADYLEEVNKGVTVMDLLSFARELEAQTDLMPRGALQTALKGHAGTLRQIHRQQIISMEQAMSALNQSMRFLERTTTDLPNKVLAVLDAIEAAQYLISQNATHLINRETGKYTATIVGYFHQYIEWVKTSLALEVAPCKPFSNMLDTAEIITCSFLVDSMNTFWMGLGCSTLFLLPSIILAVKLAKFYRRMDTEDVYDDVPTYDTMNRFPRASAPPRHIDW